MPLPFLDRGTICTHQFIAARFKSSQFPFPLLCSVYHSLSAVFSFPGWLDAIEHLFKFQKLLWPSLIWYGFKIYRRESPSDYLSTFRGKSLYEHLRLKEENADLVLFRFCKIGDYDVLVLVYRYIVILHAYNGVSLYFTPPYGFVGRKLNITKFEVHL